MHSRKLRAFSLVELLVVIAVIGIVATFAVPAVQGMLRGSAMTNAANMLTDQMSLARQHALSKNRIVEVRFYRFADPEDPGSNPDDPKSGFFRAFQFFELLDTGVMSPVSKVMRLPDTIIMNPGETLSNILTEDEASRVVAADPTRDQELAREIGHKYEYSSFRYYPDGTTSLSPTGSADKASSGGRWFITVHAESDLGRTQGNSVPPPNFFTWMVDPVSGTSKTFRPGVN